MKNDVSVPAMDLQTPGLPYQSSPSSQDLLSRGVRVSPALPVVEKDVNDQQLEL